MNLCEINLFGRAVADGEILTSKKKKKFAKFTLAVNKFEEDDEGKKESTVTYFECLVFGDVQAKMALDKIKKGDPVFVHGRPEFSAFLSKEKVAKPDITVFVDLWQVAK